MSNKTPKARYNCYLLVESLTPKDAHLALRQHYRPGQGANAMIELEAQDAPEGARAFFGTSEPRTPGWIPALQGTFSGLDNVTTQSHRLVLFLPVGKRLFAVCFGYGATTLDWACIDPNFGLRVAARVLRPTDVLELRSRRIDSSGRSQSLQFSLGAALGEMDAPLEGEFVRRLSGTLELPHGTELSRSSAGDSLSFSLEVGLSSLIDTLQDTLDIITSKAAQDEFEFLDALEPLRKSDPLTKPLDRALVAEILQRSDQFPSELTGFTFSLTEVAAPDDVSMEEVDHIEVHKVSSREAATISIPSLRELRPVLKTLQRRFAISVLTDIRLTAKSDEGESAARRSPALPLKKWLVAEIGDGAQRYILALGSWYRLSEDYTARLDSDLSRLDQVAEEFELHPCTEGIDEEDYLLTLCEFTDKLLYMNKKLLRTGTRGPIEACDLLAEDGTLIHAKIWTGSATLSHLLSQGTVAVELLRSRSDLADQFVTLADGLNQSNTDFKAAAEIAPHRLAYAILAPADRRIPLDLPTFSKVNLRDHAQRLRVMNVKPSVAHIRTLIQ